MNEGLSAKDGFKAEAKEFGNDLRKVCKKGI
jgi:hypothetical protein